jgi:hypothetical protein
MERERKFAYLALLILAVTVSIIPLGVLLYGKPFMFYRFGLPFGAYYDIIIQQYPPTYGYWLTFFTVKVFPLTSEPFLNIPLVYLIVIFLNCALFMSVGYLYFKLKGHGSK